ncbi:MAG: hemolysin family protein [Eubacteriales bacterium]|nr:hemolysin family protein [Eubacteriales bacterium]
MDEDHLRILYWTGIILSGLITPMMWYLYGAIDSINDDILETKKDAVSMRLLKYADNYHTNLIVCVLIYSFIFTGLATQHGYGWLLVVLMLIIAVSAKHVGYARAENLNPFVLRLASLFYRIATPPVAVLVFIIEAMARLMKLDIRGEYESVTEDEIIALVNDGHEQGVLEKEEAEMISNIVELGDKEAMDIMTHRKNIVALNEALTLTETAEIIISEKFSRYPVYREELDKICGILHLRDFFRIYHDPETDRTQTLADTEGLVRPAYFVPTTKNVNEIFKEMQEEKTHMAMVIDEYGQLDGILAMEDIIEEIMGNILDEYDVDETMIIEPSAEKFLVRGACPLEMLSERLQVDFGDEFETLSGFLIDRLNRIPTDDEENMIDILYGGYNFRILKIRNKMIQLVRIVRKETRTEEGEE